MKEYIIAPNGGNAVDLWREAYSNVLSGQYKRIVFSPGQYHFYPENCSQRYCYFSNNDEGIKTIALDLSGIDGLEICGDETELIFHGRISPVVAESCRDISIRGITIDFEDSFVSDADLVEISDDGISYFRIGGKHSFQDGRLVFTGDFYDNLTGKLIFFPYDTAKGELVWDKKFFAIANQGLHCRNGCIGFPHDFSDCRTNAFIIKHELRLCPGMVFSGCRDVHISEVSLHHAAGMGMLFQDCENIRVNNVRICPRNRRASVSDDALHVADCRGTIEITDSVFSGTLDDSINIHGIYRPLRVREPGGKFYYLDTGHFQQSGLPGARAGDTLVLIKNDTLIPYGQLKVTSAVQLNKAMTAVTFDEKTLPAEFTSGDCVMISEVNHAFLRIRNCRFAPLLGRGVLASGLQDAKITGNSFHTSGAAIFISGDANFWYESGPVQNMLISDNIFDNCNYLRWTATREPVGIFPEIHRKIPGFYYHTSVTVKNNTFRSSFRNLVSMRSVARARVEDNEFIHDTTYTFAPGHESGYFFSDSVAPEQVVFMDCGECVVNKNVRKQEAETRKKS